MNKIWFWLTVVSICILIYVNPEAVLPTMLNASEDTIKLCVSLCAIYAVWLGILQVMEDSGLNKKLSKLLSPISRKLFGNVDEKTNELLCMNISCNILGMGGAATPLGMKAMQRLDDGSGVANRAMIMLIVFASTSLQILPTTVIGLRITAGSLSPSNIIVPTIISAIATTFSGIFIALICENFRSKTKHKQKRIAIKKGSEK